MDDTNRKRPMSRWRVFLIVVFVLLIIHAASEIDFSAKPFELYDQKEIIMRGDGTGYHAHEVRVIFYPEATDEDIARVISSIDGENLNIDTPYMDGVALTIAIPYSLSPEEAVLALEQHPEVLSARLNNVFEINEWKNHWKDPDEVREDMESYGNE